MGCGGRRAASHTADSFFAWILLPLAHERLRAVHTEALSSTEAAPCPVLVTPAFTSPSLSLRRPRGCSGTFPSPAPHGAWGAEGGESSRPKTHISARRGAGGGTELPMSVPNKHFGGQGGLFTYSPHPPFCLYVCLFVFVFPPSFSARLSAKTACNTHKLYAGRWAGTRPSASDAQQVGCGIGDLLAAAGPGTPQRRLSPLPGRTYAPTPI